MDMVGQRRPAPVAALIPEVREVYDEGVDRDSLIVLHDDTSRCNHLLEGFNGENMPTCVADTAEDVLAAAHEYDDSDRPRKRTIVLVGSEFGTLSGVQLSLMDNLRTRLFNRAIFYVLADEFSASLHNVALDAGALGVLHRDWPIQTLLKYVTTDEVWRARTAYETDFLTQLPTLGGFTRSALEIIAKMKRGMELPPDKRAGYPQRICLVTLDGDGFKQVNDTHGHPVGDQFISAVGQAMHMCRPYDLLSRPGGDEFALLLVDEGADKAEEVGNRIVETAASFEIQGKDGVIIRPQLSFGAARFTADEEIGDAQEFLKTLWKLADESLYENKPHKSRRKRK